MVKGIGIGIGFVLGLVLGIGLVIALFFIGEAIYKMFMRNNFTVDLFKSYRRELLRNERFEELADVNAIIEKLEKKEKPREILKKYSIKIDSYIYWMPTYDGGERLTYKFDRRIVCKPAPAPKKKK